MTTSKPRMAITYRAARRNLVRGMWKRTSQPGDTFRSTWQAFKIGPRGWQRDAWNHFTKVAKGA